VFTSAIRVGYLPEICFRPAGLAPVLILMPRLFLHGFFGAPNFGDELLCRSLLEAYPSSRGFAVATRDPQVTRHTARGIASVRAVRGLFPSVGFFANLPLRMLALRRADHLLIGGGGLLQDTFSPVTLQRSAFDAAWAIRSKIPYSVVGIELGSIYRLESQQRARFVLQNARSVWCLDPQSLSAARALIGSAPTPAHEFPDLAHSLLAREALRPRSSDGEAHCVVNPTQTPARFPAEFDALIQALCRKFKRVTLAAAQPGEERAWLKLLSTRPQNLNSWFFAVFSG
jgi:polysaccharide pyruvyl transferase WcaK-like protein